jgi:hypothetical protein
MAVTWIVALAMVAPWSGRQPGAAQHHRHPVQGDVQLLGDDLAQRSADPGAEIDMAVEGGDRAVLGQHDEQLISPSPLVGRRTIRTPLASK